MTASDTYRSRVQDVRRAARARLAEIRAERVAKSRAAQAPAEPAPAAAEPPRRAPLGFTASPDASRLAALAVEIAPPQEASPETLPPERLAEPEPAPEGDLERLPGIGPGLVWILQQSGVRSLADLAAFEPPELRARVGFVGALINLEAWIAFARQSVGNRN